ncbi:gpW family head-tail joining protein [Parvibaculum sp.]|uniref:gpW family head-tail joining protein n=1 Tax=Parvibaculum sp. TaxID=2024848 RepID=UPI0027310C2E|nr:gpW family head-tail joining protein [Parvibaculum sp.]MDP1628848.1 gpW family head-tail joining protein [Parvibaculum sp.]MDP2148243.1 gpW family head-tail joining protein [Parvibaculum sp.]MDP3327855.1 gpW family head-tail joining protein [Parvibaculum sp.]
MTPTEIKAVIAKLEQAKIDLALGTKTASVSYDGKSVSFTQTDMGKINALIAELTAKLTGRPARRGFQFQF